MKGIGLEEVFTVQKRRVQQSKLIGQRREIIRKNQTKKPDDGFGSRRGPNDQNVKNGGKDRMGYRNLDNKFDQDDDNGVG